MSHVEKQRPSAAAAPAVAGKTARACDGCARRRARWYCAADDAFLCQSCDASVHSANPLARRHCRLRLNTSSSLSAAPDADENEPVPSWLRGFKRKARTPRPHHHVKRGRAASAVPELADTSVEETEDEEQQLLYCVPVFDPALAEFRSPPPLDDSNSSSVDELAKPCTPASTSTIDSAHRMAAFLPSEMELAEFAANMESLLGGGDDSFSMEKLGLMDSMEDEDDEDDDNNNNEDGVVYRLDDGGRLKTEEADETEDCQVELEIDMTRETLELNFNWPGSSTGEEDDFEEEKAEVIADHEQEAAKRAKLRLDYDAVISAWSRHGASPWTDGERPQINLDGGWAEYLGMWGDAAGGGHGSEGGGGHVDVGRQARVSRYREKRRTRLFAKKIRYEVRKLNAEKRPRMKGRFVKRAPGFAF